MKKIFFALTATLVLGFLTSCNNDNNDLEATETLIEEITNSSAKSNVEPQELPSATTAFIEEEHFETYVESAAYVDGKGYEVVLGTEDVEYFDAEGNVLRLNARPHGCHRPGPCGRGQRVAIEDLPEAITTYIADNYPDEEIRRAKLKGDYYLVGISGPTILVFESDGTFVLEAPLFRFCRAVRINIDNLSDTITSYISENCPDGEIKAAFRARGRIIVGVLTPEGRKVLVFDLDGNFLFERS